MPPSSRQAPRQERLPRPGLQTGLWFALGLLASAWVLAGPGLPPPGVAPHVLGILLAVAIATTRLDVPSVRPLRHRPHSERISLHDGSLVFLLVVLPPGWAWLLVVGGYALASIRRARGIKYVFNIGMWATTVALAVAVHGAIAAGPTGALSVRTTVALALAVLVHAVVGWLGVQVVMSAATGAPVRTLAASSWPVLARAWAGNLLLGLTGAALWLQTPWLALIALGLAFVLRGAYRQVVEARRLLDGLRLDRDRLDLVTESSTNGVVLLDHDETVTVWNSAMVQLTGIPAREAHGRRVDDVLADRAELAAGEGERPCSLATAVRVGAALEPTEALLVRRDGERRVVLVTHTLQHDEVGGVARDVVQVRDLTAQREADRLQDDFLARVSHELRTPLTSIIGFGRTLLHRADMLPAATRDELMRRLLGAGETLEDLVDDLLLVSSPREETSGRTTRSLRSQPLGPVVEAAVAEERAAHPGRVVRVHHVDEASAVIDEAWLGTVVRHLVSNALQYSHDLAPVTVEVGDRADHALVRVVDRGRGIPPTKLRTVFERFTRVEDPLRMETRGAGLGLFIVDRLVARMGGRVDVDSTLGEGSTFTVWLPHVTPDRPGSRDPVAPDALAGAGIR